MSEKLCIYHANCYDGFGAAWAAWKVWGDDAEYLPAYYGSDDRPDVRHRDVVIADFSYPRDELISMESEAMSLAVLDHHKTAEENCQGLPFARFDMEKSGAVLAWEHFHPGKPVPRLLRYVEDRDLWRWSLPQSLEISLAVRSYPMDFETWDDLVATVEDDADALIAEGAAIKRYQDQYIEAAKKFCRRVFVPELGTIPVVNAPYMGISDLLNALCDDQERRCFLPVAIAWFHRADGKYQYSLRSKGEFDVSAFAKMQGGGGHKNAAGFESDRLLW